MKGLIKIYVVLFGVLTISCTDKKMSVNEFCAWVNEDDNGLMCYKEFNGITYKAYYKPAEYITLKNLNPAGQYIESSSYFAELREVSKTENFIFQIETKSGRGDVIAAEISSREDYYNRVVYLSYYVENDFSLIENGDTMRCKLAQFEQMYTATSYARISIVFESLPEKVNDYKNNNRPIYEDMILLFDDNVWGNGLMKFYFNKKNLNNIPEIKI